MRTVLLLHRGGDNMRGTESCLIQSARAFAGEGLRVVVGRNQTAMDEQLSTVEPSPTVLAMEFPELKLDGKQSTFPFGAYARAVRYLNATVNQLRPALIYCSGGLPCQLAVPVGRLRRIPVVCHFHHPAIKRDYYVWLVKGADKVIYPSQYTRRHSLQKAGVDGEVIYNGVDIDRFQPAFNRDPSWRERLGIPGDAIVIGQVAALVGHKRPELLVHTFASLIKHCSSRLHLCMVGKGVLEDPLRDLVRELHLEAHVTITGVVPDVLPYYQHVFDIKALVSREEGLGIAVLEASACGLPVVATDCTGLSETVVPDQTGFLFPLNDTAALESQLRRLVEDPALRTRQGAAGRALVQQTFATSLYNQRMNAAIRNLMR